MPTDEVKRETTKYWGSISFHPRSLVAPVPAAGPELALSHFEKSARFYNAAGMGAAADMAVEAGNRLRADIAQ